MFRINLCIIQQIFAKLNKQNFKKVALLEMYAVYRILCIWPANYYLKEKSCRQQINVG